MKGDFKIAVIGLGLIGGSLAYALKGFRNASIVGCDINPKTRNAALKNKAVMAACENAGDAIDGADLVVFCTYPDIIETLIKENRDRFKKGAVVSDVCGVKEGISKKIRAAIPDSADYVGGHPMAGKEVDGFENASSELFWMTGFIVTPDENSKESSIALLKEMAKYIGATRIAMASPREHDKVIAYTSDLMHVAASALCLDYPSEMNRAYTAGAFRDCTRIARINGELWSSLLISNRENVVSEIDRLIGSLGKIRERVETGDRANLEQLLNRVCENKLTMQKKEPEQSGADE